MDKYVFVIGVKLYILLYRSFVLLFFLFMFCNFCHIFCLHVVDIGWLLMLCGLSMFVSLIHTGVLTKALLLLTNTGTLGASLLSFWHG